tara:strand:+ start:106774 stop:108309 length:1536 start_codon:yes stop_codon:yes gene_type:complete
MISSFEKPLNNFFSWYLERRIKEINFFINEPIQVQDCTLLTNINNAERTKFGSKYNFYEIKDPSTFKNRVPLLRYKDLAPYIFKMKKGESNILWPGKVKWFAQSSGTTNKQIKHIPITKESLKKCHFKGGKDLLALYYNENPETRLFNGKHLIAGGSSSTYFGNNKTVIGDLSAIIMQHLPWWCEWRRSPRKKENILIDNWKKKLDYIINSTKEDDIHIIAGVPSWIYLILNGIIERFNLSSINEVWPNLELYLHGGVNIDPYKNSFKGFFEKKINFYQNYNATEGFFGLQNINNVDDMLLMLDYGIYYEFIQKKDWNNEQPKTLSLNEINLNEPYELVISTNGGLWRYRLEDTIVFTNKNPYKIKVLGRTKQFLNAFGEELMIHNLEYAIKMAAHKTNSKISEFTVCPIIERKENSLGHHHWVIEFIIPPNDIREFENIIDIELSINNIDYCQKRKNNSPIGFPKISVVKKGTFNNWMEKRGKLGVQNKVPRVFESNKYVKEILKVEEII